MPLKNINRHIHYVDWPAQKVLALTTTRHNPIQPFDQKVDLTKYSTFNLGDHVGDNHEQVITNRHSLLSLLPDNTYIQWFEQTHGTDVAVIESVVDNPIVADAAITRAKDVALSIMTADCLPILLATKNGNEIAAIHGGWRPLVGNIIANTLAKMTANPSEIVAWLGPCIGSNAFEVGAEVKQKFTEQSATFEQAFKKRRELLTQNQENLGAKYFANLALIARLQLNLLGITNVSGLPHCTFSKKNEYFSYRREGRTGRMASVICRT